MGNAMDAQNVIARRIARELRSGMLVNLGIGIPTLVASYVPDDVDVFFQSENGLIGTGPIPEQGMAHPMLTDAGGGSVTALPGASTFDSAMSFALIRGGHVDISVLGGLEVDEGGRLDRGCRLGHGRGPRTARANCGNEIMKAPSRILEPMIVAQPGRSGTPACFGMRNTCT